MKEILNWSAHVLPPETNFMKMEPIVEPLPEGFLSIRNKKQKIGHYQGGVGCWSLGLGKLV